MVKFNPKEGMNMKKTRKRMILLLAAVLLLALLPLSALAEEISDLHLTVPVPAEGMKPSDAAPALSTGAGYPIIVQSFVLNAIIKRRI